MPAGAYDLQCATPHLQASSVSYVDGTFAMGSASNAASSGALALLRLPSSMSWLLSLWLPAAALDLLAAGLAAELRAASALLSLGAVCSGAAPNSPLLSPPPSASVSPPLLLSGASKPEYLPPAACLASSA